MQTLEAMKLLVESSVCLESTGMRDNYIRGLDNIERAYNILLDMLPIEIQDKLNEDR